MHIWCVWVRYVCTYGVYGLDSHKTLGLKLKKRRKDGWKGRQVGVRDGKLFTISDSHITTHLSGASWCELTDDVTTCHMMTSLCVIELIMLGLV